MLICPVYRFIRFEFFQVKPISEIISVIFESDNENRDEDVRFQEKTSRTPKRPRLNTYANSKESHSSFETSKIYRGVYKIKHFACDRDFSL